MGWEEDKHKIVSLYHDCINVNNNELFSRLQANPEKSRDIYEIAKFIIDRLLTVWFLAMQDMLWDADIIDRAVLETLVKLVFIINASTEEEQRIRLNEFWNDLWEINSLKHSEHSKKHVLQFKDTASQLAHLSLILSEEQEDFLRKKWNRKDRKSLERKWSFSEMLFSLMKDYKGQSFEMLIGLAHEYRMCSHVAHGDETGIAIIAERKSRPEKQREIVHRAHFIKLLSNCLAYSSWLSINVMDFLKEDKKLFFENFSRISEIKNIEKQYHEEVFNDPDYDKYR